MTDFVVSKVVMSICALLVAGGLAGIVETSLKADPGEDLETILADIQETLSSLAAHGGGCVMAWTVPALPSGSAVRMSFGEGSMMARADGVARAAETQPELHTWAWDGQPLNLTKVEELDSSSPDLEAWTGHVLTLTACEVLVDDCPELLVFVR